MGAVRRIPAQGAASRGIPKGMPILLDARRARVGAGEVRRLLPHPRCRRIGAWCFVDHFGPVESAGPGVGPHPHIGLQTVTWLVEGRMHHGDSLGSQQTIAPGELNLMTAGRGITHWELSDSEGTSHGVQLWVALPESRRHGPPAFEHHNDLPTTAVDGWSATVLVGRFAGRRSPATVHTPLLGVELVGSGPTTIPLEAGFEHAIVVLQGSVRVDGAEVDPRQLAVLPADATRLTLGARHPARVLLLGGAPFETPLAMWWNFVARSHDELAAAQADWQANHPRFGDPTVFPEGRIDAPRMPQVHLVPR
ncbi:MAG: redox-sensitive bicupin YhaK (pirin superfamily) [Myxococcota bacterium]